MAKKKQDTKTIRVSAKARLKLKKLAILEGSIIKVIDRLLNIH